MLHAGAGGNKLASWGQFESIIRIEALDMDSQLARQYHAQYIEMLHHLQEKQAKGIQHKTLLRHLFYRVHKKLLKQYQPYLPFTQVFESGQYGCLTGTALYSLLLTDLGYQHQIIETTYHVFIILEVDEQQFCFEATDPVYGFIAGEKEITDKLRGIAEEDKNYDKEGKYKFSVPVQQSISFQNLVGLQYYNQAVKAYNQGDYAGATERLTVAVQLHPSDRFREFARLIQTQQAEQRTIAIKSD